MIWCHLNDEGDILEKSIPDCVQVSGSDSDEAKEAAYMGFADGSIRVLVIKPKIGAWGMNWQHCAHVVTFASHSYEQYYQAVRRCWRFGQKKSVVVDLIASEGEIGVKENMRGRQPREHGEAGPQLDHQRTRGSNILPGQPLGKARESAAPAQCRAQAVAPKTGWYWN